LKAVVDDRKHVLMLRNKAANQLLAAERRTDDLLPETIEWLQDQVDHLSKEEAKRRRRVAKACKEYAETDPLTAAAIAVPGIGELTVAQCVVYIDLTKARHASSLWSYAGLDKPSHARYSKGEGGGGNKTLRTALYTMAESQVKSNGAYRPVYDRTKERLAKSEKLTKSRNTQGHLIACAWKDTKPCHRDGAALRAVMKAFLADYWYVGRALCGLPNGPGYAEAQLGGNHRTVMPQERGWRW
jgi:transposase